MIDMYPVKQWLCSTKGLAAQAGVHGSAHILDHHVTPAAGSLELGQDITDVAPDAALPDGVSVDGVSNIRAGVDGSLRSPSSVAAAQGQTGTPAIIGGVLPEDRTSSIGTSVSSMPTHKVLPTDVPSNDQKITQTDVEVHMLHPSDPVMSNKDATKSKKGFFGKVKDALS